MSKKEDLIVGLDIGTTKVCVIVAAPSGDGIDIIGIGTHPSRGLALPREIALGKEQDPEGIVLRLPGIEARFVFGAKDLDARVGMLAELLAKRPAEVAEAASVDLRFLGQAVLSGKTDPMGSA